MDNIQIFVRNGGCVCNLSQKTFIICSGVQVLQNGYQRFCFSLKTFELSGPLIGIYVENYTLVLYDHCTFSTQYSQIGEKVLPSLVLILLLSYYGVNEQLSLFENHVSKTHNFKNITAELTFVHCVLNKKIWIAVV